MKRLTTTRKYKHTSTHPNRSLFLVHPPQVYVGHEYTVSNLRFAQVAEPHNAAVQKKLAWAEDQRKVGQ